MWVIKGGGRLQGRYDAKSWVLKDDEQFANREASQGWEGEQGEGTQLAQMIQPGERSAVWPKHKGGQRGEGEGEAAAVGPGQGLVVQAKELTMTALQEPTASSSL